MKQLLLVLCVGLAASSPSARAMDVRTGVPAARYATPGLLQGLQGAVHSGAPGFAAIAPVMNLSRDAKHLNRSVAALDYMAMHLPENFAAQLEAAQSLDGARQETAMRDLGVIADHAYRLGAKDAADAVAKARTSAAKSVLLNASAPEDARAVAAELRALEFYGTGVTRGLEGLRAIADQKTIQGAKTIARVLAEEEGWGHEVPSDAPAPVVQEGNLYRVPDAAWRTLAKPEASGAIDKHGDVVPVDFRKTDAVLGSRPLTYGEEQLITFLQWAGKEITVHPAAMESMSPRVAEAIEAAKQRGVNVKIAPSADEEASKVVAFPGAKKTPFRDLLRAIVAGLKQGNKMAALHHEPGILFSQGMREDVLGVMEPNGHASADGTPNIVTNGATMDSEANVARHEQGIAFYSAVGPERSTGSGLTAKVLAALREGNKMAALHHEPGILFSEGMREDILGTVAPKGNSNQDGNQGSGKGGPSALSRFGRAFLENLGKANMNLAVMLEPGLAMSEGPHNKAAFPSGSAFKPALLGPIEHEMGHVLYDETDAPAMSGGAREMMGDVRARQALKTAEELRQAGIARGVLNWFASTGTGLATLGAVLAGIGTSSDHMLAGGLMMVYGGLMTSLSVLILRKGLSTFVRAGRYGMIALGIAGVVATFLGAVALRIGAMLG